PMEDTGCLTAIAEAFAFAALIDAAVAAVVAVAAYYEATRGPVLRLLVGWPTEALSFLGRADGDPRDPLVFKRDVRLAVQVLELHFSILNLSKYSGRNQALRMELDPQALSPSAQPSRSN